MQSQKSPGRALIIALGLTQIISWGTLYYTFALLLQSLQDTLQCSQTTVVGAFSLALLIYGASSPFVGHLIDRYGGRKIMALGSLLSGCMLILLAQVKSVAALYFILAGCGFAMSMTLYEPAFAILAYLYQHQARRAITLVTLFGGFASSIFWPLGQYLISLIGWSYTLSLLALLHLIICAPLHWIFIPPKHDTESSTMNTPQSGQWKWVLTERVFYLLVAAFTLNIFVFSALAVHLLAILQEQGSNLATAAAIGALIGPMQIIGRLLEYRFAQHFQVYQVGILAAACMPIALYLLGFIHGWGWAAWGFAFLFGYSNGVMTIVRATLPAEIFGINRFATIQGAIALPVIIAKAAGPLVASSLYSWLPNYRAVLAWLIGIALLAVFALAAGGKRDLKK